MHVLAITFNSHYADLMKSQATVYRCVAPKGACSVWVPGSARGLAVVAATLMISVLCPPACAADDAGVVKTSQGKVLIVRDGESLPAAVGSIVRQGDILRTAEGASAGVMLKDDTRVALGANSQVALDQFAFNANTNEGTLFVSVLKGTLSMISGLLVKANPQRVGVKTPTATIGIRGTEFIVDVP
jgi:hypothetical protein